LRFENTTAAKRGRFLAVTQICSIADTLANQLIARLFLRTANVRWNIGTARGWNRAGRGKDPIARLEYQALRHM